MRDMTTALYAGTIQGEITCQQHAGTTLNTSIIQNPDAEQHYGLNQEPYVQVNTIFTNEFRQLTGTEPVCEHCPSIIQ